MSKYKYGIEMLSAINSGQETEWKRMTGEWLPDKEPQNTCLNILNDPKRYRVKEPPRKVPFGPEDIKPCMVFRATGSQFSWWPFSCVDNGGIKIDQVWHSWDSLRERFEYSTDGVTWHRCEKESKE